MYWPQAADLILVMFHCRWRSDMNSFHQTVLSIYLKALREMEKLLQYPTEKKKRQRCNKVDSEAKVETDQILFTFDRCSCNILSYDSTPMFNASSSSSYPTS